MAGEIMVARNKWQVSARGDCQRKRMMANPLYKQLVVYYTLHIACLRTGGADH